jgi:NTP pyrophosphatase (non-canonical NTP hydrolase)
MPSHLAQVSAEHPSDGFDSLAYISERLSHFRQARLWERFHTPKNLAISVSIEAGELLEHFQWRSDDEVEAHLRDHETAVASELADVAIYVVQLADALGVSLADAIGTKLDENAERYPIALARGNHLKHSELHRHA